MTFDQLIKHFGTQAEAAAALGCSQPCISNWKKRGQIPTIQQIKAEYVTKGKLKADIKLFRR